MRITARKTFRSPRIAGAGKTEGAERIAEAGKTDAAIERSPTIRARYVIGRAKFLLVCVFALTLYRIAPISTNLILSYIATHELGLPRSF